MISKEEENRTKQIRENLITQKSLYDTYKDVYDKVKPVSRILIMLKIVQVIEKKKRQRKREGTK